MVIAIVGHVGSCAHGGARPTRRLGRGLVCICYTEVTMTERWAQMNQNLVYRRLAAYCLLFGVLGGLALWYGTYAPRSLPDLLRCPLFSLTGIQCPLCGGQRAVHALIHGAWGEAWRWNPLVVGGLAVAPLYCYGPVRKGIQRHQELATAWIFVMVVLFVVVRNV